MRERKGPGTKVPGSFRSLGMKVLHRDLSFLGTKGLGYEKSVIRLCGWHLTSLTVLGSVIWIKYGVDVLVH